MKIEKMKIKKENEDNIRRSKLMEIALEVFPKKTNRVKSTNGESPLDNFSVYGFLGNLKVEVNPITRAVAYSHKRHKHLAQNLSDRYNEGTSYNDWGSIAPKSKDMERAHILGL